MPFRSRNRHQNIHQTTKPTLMTRLRGRHAKTQTVKTTTTATPAHGHHTNHTNHTNHNSGHNTHTHNTHNTATHHQRRKVSFGDKVSGAMLKLRGTLTGRSGVKAAGTRRMHGTDGRGSHRAY